MSEIELTRKIKEMIKREFLGSYVIRFSDRFVAGISDLGVICYGMFGALEVKMPGQKKKNTKFGASPIQDKFLEYVQDAGGEVGVVVSVDEARLWMHKFYKAAKLKHDTAGIGGTAS